MYTYCCFLLLCIFITVSTSINLYPLEVITCPKNNKDGHTTNDHSCYEMVKRNVSCFSSSFLFHGNHHHHGNDHYDNKTSLQDMLDSNIFDRLFEVLGHPEQYGHGLYERNCTVNTCVRKCCPGWTKDIYGRCNQKERHCENGGTQIAKGVCACPRNFAGFYCETPVCQNECLNGGTCTQQTATGNQCNCPEPYKGPNCEDVNCTLECDNGGLCVVSGFEPVCLCPEGFYGKTCSFSLKNRYCPLPYSANCDEAQGCFGECTSSLDCTMGHVCCDDGCCNKCMEPVNAPCHFKGTEYRVGETFRSDKCTVCTCFIGGTVSCTEITCPEPKPCMSSSFVMSKDTCCPTCGSNSTILPPNYQPPILRNCLKYGILTVPTWSDTAYVTGLRIQAYDFENKALRIHYSPLKLEHCKCTLPNRMPHPVVVSAKDRFGHSSECKFPVLLLDKTPPSFVTCPTDIYALETEMITWTKPATRDNVGVYQLKLDPPGRGLDGYFPVGNHTMTYTAIDYDGNREFCQFTIFAFDKDTDLSQMPEGLARRQREQSIQIIAGCLAVAFLAFAVILVLCFARRWRLRRATAGQRQRDQRVPAVSNGEYGAFSVLFRAASIKPPPYSPPSPPPAYEELAVNAGSSDTDMPPRYEEIDTYVNTMTVHAYDNVASNGVSQQQHSSEAVDINYEHIRQCGRTEHRYDNRSVQNTRCSGRSETIV